VGRTPDLSSGLSGAHVSLILEYKAPASSVRVNVRLRRSPLFSSPVLLHHAKITHESGWELLYFKVYKSQLAVIEQALETASLMLGGQKSRGYRLEMISADFLAGANLEDPNPVTLSNLILRFLEFLPAGEKRELLGAMRECA
jgi:hypothetical protein